MFYNSFMLSHTEALLSGNEFKTAIISRTLKTTQRFLRGRVGRWKVGIGREGRRKSNPQSMKKATQPTSSGKCLLKYRNIPEERQRRELWNLERLSEEKIASL